MTKQLVETTGPFQVVDPRNGTVVRHDRPTVVTLTHFVHVRTNVGQLRVLDKALPEGADDADFAGFWRESKGDKDLAVQSYRASLEPAPELEPKSKAKGK